MSPILPVPALKASTDGYWKLVGSGEPFRLLFPIGAAIGMTGVMLWPLFVWNISTVYPGPFHARVMIEGFLTAFVVGFLGTALPRLLDAPRWTAIEAVGFAGALIIVTVLHATGRTLPGDVVFLLTMLALILALGARALLHGRDVPPPAFVLVLLGLGCAVLGSGTQIATQLQGEALPEGAAALGRLLLLQGYLIFPVMGVGAFLLPRFFDLPSRQSFPESVGLPAGWCKEAGFALACGGIVLAGFVAETAGAPHWGNALRAAGILIYFLRELPVHRAGWGGGSLAFGLRIALLSIPLAYALMSVWPGRTFSFLHILYISGFSLLAFIVASRVVLGHGGQSARFRATIKPVIALTILVVIAMLTRVTADWMPESRMTHYAYAAVSWVIGVGVWSVTILRGVRHPDTGPEVRMPSPQHLGTTDHGTAS